MKIVFRTRYPLRRIILLLLLSAVSSFYYLQNHPPQQETRAQAGFISISPVVNKIEPPVPASEPVTKTIQIKKDQTFSEVMQSAGFAPDAIQEIYGSARDVYNLSQIHTGKQLILTRTPENELAKLEYAIDPFKTLVIERTDSGLHPAMLEHPSEVRVEEIGGFIEGSLYYTINHLGEDDELVINFADIFEWDVDFFKDLQEGDSFRIVYERKYVQGEPFGYGRILAAELNNKNKLYTAIGFQRGKNWEYFSTDGKAMKKAFLASPLKFSRISSGFTSRRYHPVLKGYRPHYGIDYAAPTGTPVRAIGQGTVILAGRAGGAGNTIKIQHSKEIATVYCHLSRFASGVRRGKSVRQGQVIGYVGMTGLATGPHLDFRYLKNGKYINFLSIKSPQADPLTAGELAQFQTASQQIAAQLGQVRLRSLSDVSYDPPLAMKLSENIR